MAAQPVSVDTLLIILVALVTLTLCGVAYETARMNAKPTRDPMDDHPRADDRISPQDNERAMARIVQEELSKR